MTLIWGTNYSIVKSAFREVDPQAFNAIRMVLTSGERLILPGWRSGHVNVAGAAPDA